MSYVIVFVLLVGVVLIVSEPLRRPRGSEVNDSGEGAEAGSYGKVDERLDLEAARDAKYREIRDAELDHQTGKLSDEDFQAIDSSLRAEAVELLRQLEDLDAREAAE
jgi:hypothetical protein